MLASLSRKLLTRLSQKPFREAYVEENVRLGIAYQIRALREQRGWSQAELARRLMKPQSTISRIEDPDYGKLSVQTLIEVADAFDVAMLIRYVSFPEMIVRTRDVSPAALQVESFDERAFTTRPTIAAAETFTSPHSPMPPLPAAAVKTDTVVGEQRLVAA